MRASVRILSRSFVMQCREYSSSIYTYSYINEPYNELWVDTMPWVGLLWYKEPSNTEEAISGIILLTKKIAIGNTQEISKIDKKYIRSTTKAMFLSPEDHTWYCQVIDYTLHPEFGQDTLNTVAVIKLEYEEENYQWQYLEWPLFPLLSVVEDIFAIGFTDRRGVLEQVVYKMKQVQLSDCIKFYEEEQLDMKWTTPMEYHCFKTKLGSEQCVFDAGMALVTNYTGNWILLGMSTLGPGCSLPSRFLNFSSYAPWLEKAANITREYKSRRTEPLAYENDWSIDEIRDSDRYFMEKLNDNSIVLKPVTENDTEYVYGSCQGVIMYWEDVKVEVEGDGEHGYGIYKLSHYDKYFANLTCISLTVDCLKKSKLDVWQTRGFEKDDITPYVKRVPLLDTGVTVGPKIKFIVDNWGKYERVNITNLLFKFEYYKKATLTICFYGTEVIAPTEMSTTEDTLSTTMRTRRPHNTHLRPRKAMRGH